MLLIQRHPPQASVVLRLCASGRSVAYVDFGQSQLFSPTGSYSQLQSAEFLRSCHCRFNATAMAPAVRFEVGLEQHANAELFLKRKILIIMP